MAILDLPDELLARIIDAVLGKQSITLFRDETSQKVRQYRRLCLANRKMAVLANDWLQHVELCVHMDEFDQYCSSSPSLVRDHETTELLLQNAGTICVNFFASYRLKSYTMAPRRLTIWQNARLGRTLRFSIPPDYKALPRVLPSEAWTSFCMSLMPPGTPINWTFDFSGPDYSENSQTPVFWKAVEEQNEEVVHMIARIAPDTRFACSSIHHLAVQALSCSPPSILSAVLDLRNIKLDDEFKLLLNSTLLLAALQGKNEAAKILLQRGADVHGLGPPATPLFCATTRNHQATIQLLKDSGARM